MADAVAFGALDLLSDPYGLSPQASFGDPLPLTDVMASLFRDGTVVSGARSDNREIRFQVSIHSTTRLGLVLAESALATEVDKQANVLTVTPNGGQAVAFDTYRGHVLRTWDNFLERSFTRTVEVTLPAQPFGRTPTPVTATSSPLFTATSNGSLESFAGIIGDARAPVSLDVHNSGVTAFSTVVVYKSPPESHARYSPLVPMGATDLDGATRYALPTIAGEFRGPVLNGTYSVWAKYSTVTSAGTARTLSLKFRLFTTDAYQTANTPIASETVISLTHTPSSSAADKFVRVGEVTLPALDYDATFTGQWRVVGLSTITTDQLSEILVLDNRGSGVIIPTGASAYKHWYLREPTALQDYGSIVAGDSLATAVSPVTADTVIMGNPLNLDPGTNGVLLWSPNGIPTVTATYSPRWRGERGVA
jgi:hypothetical protein